VTAEQLDTLPLSAIVLRLTPRDIEFFVSKHSNLTHYNTQIKLCRVADAADCWYCSRFGERHLPAELQTLGFFPLYSQVQGDSWMRLPARRAAVLRGEGAIFFSDDALPQRIIQSAYEDARTAEPSRELVAMLARRTLLEPEEVKALFAAHHKKAAAKSRWEGAHLRCRGVGGGSSGNAPVALEQADALVYDASLVGRRITVLWGVGSDAEPEEREDSDFYPATIVAYKASNRRFKYVIHFDDTFSGGKTSEKVGLPDESIRIMTEIVTACACPSCAAGRTSRPLPLGYDEALL
jgi:hypothetical protein